MSRKSTKPSWISIGLEYKTLTAFILAASILGVSLLALRLIPIEIMPRENIPPLVLVRINFENADEPENNEVKLAETIEGQLRAVSHLKRQRTSVDSRGISISLSLEAGSDLDLIDLEIIENLEALATEGLFNMKNVSLMRMNPESSATMRIALQKVSSERINLKRLQSEIQNTLESAIGVAKIEISGLEPSQAEMTLSFKHLRSLRIPPSSIARALQFPQQTMNIGALESNSSKTTLSVVPPPLSLSDLLKIPIDPQSGLNLSDLGSLSISNRSDTEILHLDGNSAFMIEIYPKFGANLFELGDSIQKKINDWNGSPQGRNSRLSIVYNLVDELSLSIQNVVDSLLQAMLITFFVVFFFYRRLDLVLIINFSIPLCLLFTVGALYVLGKSLNLLTLSGLILSIGVVVDNAALVLERTDELIKETQTTVKKSVALAAQEVIGPLTLSSLTNALIFVPLLFVDDSDSFMALLKAFQIPIIGSLVASLLIAVLFVPLIRILYPYPKQQVSSEETGARTGILETIYRYKFLFGIASVMAFVGTLDIFSRLESSDLSSPRDPFAVMTLKFSPEIDSNVRKQKFIEIEKAIKLKKSEFGFSRIVSEYQPQQLQGSLTFFVPSSTNRDDSLNQLEARISEWIASLPQEIGIAMNIGFGSQYGKIAENSFSIAFAAKNSLQFESFFTSLLPIFQSTQTLDKFQLDKEANSNYQLALFPRNDLLTSYRIPASLASQTILGAMTGSSLENVEWQKERLTFKTQVFPEISTSKFTPPRWTQDDIEKLGLRVSEREIPIGQLFNFVQMPSSQVINRQDRKSLQRIHFSVKNPNTLSQTREMVNQYFSAYFQNASSADSKKYPGISLLKNPSLANIEDMQRKTLFILGLSILLIYLVLAAIFESLFTPLSVILSIPVALSFGTVGLWLMHVELDVMARLGLVMLVGICVNNAIILIDLILKLRQRGFSRKESIVNGCSRRLRAVLMTTVIQILSVLPVAMGEGKLMGIPYASLGIVIISGMLFSTIILFTLLPVSYELFDDLEAFFSRRNPTN